MVHVLAVSFRDFWCFGMTNLFVEFRFGSSAWDKGKPAETLRALVHPSSHHGVAISMQVYREGGFLMSFKVSLLQPSSFACSTPMVL